MDGGILDYAELDEPDDELPIDDGGLPSNAAHSAEAVRDAVARLSAWDLNRLQAAGRQLVRQYRLDPVVRDHDSLVAEAMTRTLSGKRGWRKDCELAEHLVAIMSSIASNWRKRAVRRAEAEAAEARESDVETEADDGKVRNPVRDAPGRQPGAERALSAKARLEAIWQSFAHDEIVCAILEGWKHGVPGPEIRLQRKISEKDYRAAVRRLRRSLRKEVGDDR